MLGNFRSSHRDSCEIKKIRSQILDLANRRGLEVRKDLTIGSTNGCCCMTGGVVSGGSCCCMRGGVVSGGYVSGGYVSGGRKYNR